MKKGVTPFVTSNYAILSFHWKLTLFLIIKWIINAGKCHLTLFENWLRGTKEEDGFIYSIIEPIYSINFVSQQHFKYSIYIITFMLGLTSYIKSEK